jgi:large subunit ribosomal protein L18e
MKITVEKDSVKRWLALLSEASKGKHYPALWKRVHSLSAVPSRSRRNVNLYKLDRNTNDGDNVIIPGKLLSEGKLTHKVNVCAIEYSAAALDALKGSDSKVVPLDEMIKANKVKIIA